MEKSILPAVLVLLVCILSSCRTTESVVVDGSGSIESSRELTDTSIKRGTDALGQIDAATEIIADTGRREEERKAASTTETAAIQAGSASINTLLGESISAIGRSRKAIQDYLRGIDTENGSPAQGTGLP